MAENFSKFAAKILSAVKGKLSKKEMGTLARLLGRTRKRNVVLAAGLLSALKVGGASQGDIEKFAEVLEKANGRIHEGREPFTRADEAAIARIFESAGMPVSAEKKLKHNVQADRDDLLAGEIVNSLTTSTAQRLRRFVPAKQIPTVSFEGKEKKMKRARG